jgi:transposase-like protein
MATFPDSSACRLFLAKLRWRNGFVCPACGKVSLGWNESRNRIGCAICRHQTSVTTGTILQKTRIPLTAWLDGAWFLTTPKIGCSAKSLQRALGIGYRTAWTMLQRYRVAMVRADRGKLSGTVEVDETLVGGVQQGGKRGRGTTNSVVVIALETKDFGYGRVRIRHIPDASSTHLHKFISDVVVKGSTVRTDGWTGYKGLNKLNYVHVPTSLSSSKQAPHNVLIAVHQVCGLLKRWILGTHQGCIVPCHLQSYLEEFTFRFNRRSSKSRGLLFYTLMEQAMVTGPVTEADVTDGYNW